MTVLKYWDVGSNAYRVLTGPPGPAGVSSPYIVVTNLQTNPPNVNSPPVNPPTGLLVADTSVPDPVTTGFLPLVGGSLSGPLLLAADPTMPLGASTKQYVDGNYLPLAGGTLTGPLAVNSATSPQATLSAATWHASLTIQAGGAGSGASVLLNTGTTNGQAFLNAQKNGSQRWILSLIDATAESGGNVGSNITLYRYSDAGAYLDAPLTITRSTGAVAIKGTSTNDNAAAGMVGEVVSASVGATNVPTSGSPVTIMSMSLTPGDWDVSGFAYLTTGTGGATSINAWISPPGAWPGLSTTSLNIAIAASVTQALAVPVARLSIATTTTVSMLVQFTFPSGICQGSGSLFARRRR